MSSVGHQVSSLKDTKGDPVPFLARVGIRFNHETVVENLPVNAIPFLLDSYDLISIPVDQVLICTSRKIVLWNENKQI